MHKCVHTYTKHILACETQLAISTSTGLPTPVLKSCTCRPIQAAGGLMKNSCGTQISMTPTSLTDHETRTVGHLLLSGVPIDDTPGELLVHKYKVVQILIYHCDFSFISSLFDPVNLTFLILMNI